MSLDQSWIIHVIYSITNSYSLKVGRHFFILLHFKTWKSVIQSLHFALLKVTIVDNLPDQLLHPGGARLGEGNNPNVRLPHSCTLK